MQKQLTPQQDLTRSVLENLSTAVVLLNGELCVEYMNPSSEMLFAMSLHKGAGLPWASLVLKPDSFPARMREALQSGHPFTEREFVMVLANGSALTIDCSVTPLNETHGEPAILVEILNLDRHLRISKEENLISQHHAARQVIRGLAHEVKNPLGGIRGAAQLLEQELPNEALKEYTQVIIEEVDRLQNLVNRMLGPSTLPQKKMINLHQVMERVYSLARVEAPEGVVVIRDYDPSIPMFEADPEQLIQAVLNLVRNALQAVGDEGEVILQTRIQRQITIGHTRHRLVAVISIIDNGPGIPEEMLLNVFYPMITGRANGTGLGLSIAQSLINRHGGLIECKSQPGHTVFQVLIPLESIHE